jgi:peptide chain release factor 2
LPILSGVPTNYGGIFDYETKQERLVEVIRELEQPNIWDDPTRAQALGKERAILEDIVLVIDQLETKLTETQELLELVAAEDDQAALNDIINDLDRCEQQLKQLEFQRMFSGEMDANNAYLDIQAGSGGTEAQDWANMLLRMYLRWGERHKFKTCK